MTFIFEFLYISGRNRYTIDKTNVCQSKQQGQVEHRCVAMLAAYHRTDGRYGRRWTDGRTNSCVRKKRQYPQLALQLNSLL